MTDLVKATPLPPSILDREPDQMISRATRIATILAHIIQKQKLASKISGKDYIRLEGWNMMGTMLGFTPYEADVKCLPDGSYEATVEIRNIKSGEVVSRASALCGMDEKRWGSADRFARRSMAVTRATGKAYRLGFSWVMGLAGYEVTAAEDMPGYEPVPVKDRGHPFDAKNSRHIASLEKQLEDRPEIPRSEYTAIAQIMDGRYADEFDAMIELYRGGRL